MALEALCSSFRVNCRRIGKIPRRNFIGPIPPEEKSTFPQFIYLFFLSKYIYSGATNQLYALVGAGYVSILRPRQDTFNRQIQPKGYDLHRLLFTINKKNLIYYIHFIIQDLCLDKDRNENLRYDVCWLKKSS